MAAQSAPGRDSDDAPAQIAEDISRSLVAAVRFSFFLGGSWTKMAAFPSGRW